MSQSRTPRVSIGLPVHNGEPFLEATLDALLTQTFDDFELIISDNASTDRTGALCCAYAERDRRIRYTRLPKNIGAAGNWNRVLQLASAPYFKWAAHDDLHQPEFIARCAQALDADPTVVLAYPRAITIDDEGRVVTGAWGARPEFSAAVPLARFAAGLSRPRDPLPLPLFGVARADSLRRTGLMDSRPNCDRMILAELSLYGRFRELAEPLFLQRDHSRRAGPRLAGNPAEAVYFWDPSRHGKVGYPHWGLLGRLLGAVARAPLTRGQRVRCYAAVLTWARAHSAHLREDLLLASQHLPLLGPPSAQARRGYMTWAWDRKLQRAVDDIDRLLPTGSIVVLVDDAALGVDQVGGRRLLPFIERDGVHWGAPSDSQHAIRELERMRAAGASHIVFAWPSFWWLDHYVGFYEYLKARFHCLQRDRRLIIYALAPMQKSSSDS